MGDDMSPSFEPVHPRSAQIWWAQGGGERLHDSRKGVQGATASALWSKRIDMRLLFRIYRSPPGLW